MPRERYSHYDQGGSYLARVPLAYWRWSIWEGSESFDYFVAEHNVQTALEPHVARVGTG